jgi:hypothetical protein
VEIDEIIDIDISNFSGHVFNLENKDNLYMVNKAYNVNNNFAVVHNCRCAVIAQMKDTKPTVRRENVGDKDIIEYKTYWDWWDDQQKIK